MFPSSAIHLPSTTRNTFSPIHRNVYTVLFEGSHANDHLEAHLANHRELCTKRTFDLQRSFVCLYHKNQETRTWRVRKCLSLLPLPLRFETIQLAIEIARVVARAISVVIVCVHERSNIEVTDNTIFKILSVGRSPRLAANTASVYLS